MRKFTGKALLVGAAAVMVSTMTTTPAAAAERVLDKCRADQTQCVLGNYWWKKGSKYRGLNTVYADRYNVSKSKTYYGRWLYKKPGGSAHVGKGWKKATIRADDEGNLNADAGWGKPNSRTGPKFPKGTLICTQFKGSSKKACSTLK